MGYAEFHLSSDSDQRSLRSTVSRPIFELNESIEPSAFTLKSASIPLTWCTLTTPSSFVVSVSDASNFPNPSTIIWRAIVPDACYTLTTLAEKLQALIRGFENVTSGPYTVLQAGSVANPDYSTVNVNLLSDLRMEFFIFFGFATGDRFVRFEWEGGLKTVANRSSEEEATLDVLYDVDNIVGTPEKFKSKYPWRLIPNFIYLHSNIMSGTRYGRHLRPQGGFKSNTILAKIPIDFEYVFGSQIMPYVNPSLDPAYLFGNTALFNHLEFWLTDEFGTELDLQNVGFSLTLAMIL